MAFSLTHMQLEMDFSSFEMAKDVSIATYRPKHNHTQNVRHKHSCA